MTDLRTTLAALNLPDVGERPHTLYMTEKFRSAELTARDLWALSLERSLVAACEKLSALAERVKGLELYVCAKCRGRGEFREFGIGYAILTTCNVCNGTGRGSAK